MGKSQEKEVSFNPRSWLVVRMLWDAKLKSRECFLMLLEFLPYSIDELGLIFKFLHPAGGSFHIRFIIRRENTQFHIQNAVRAVRNIEIIKGLPTNTLNVDCIKYL